MSGKALVLRADAGRLPLPDASADLVMFSPPYFGLRSYRDGDEHYDGQMGSEPTPQAFLEALWAVMHECWRVLKPTGSCFVNLGDKRSGSGGHNNGGLTGATSSLSTPHRAADVTRLHQKATRRNAPDRYNQAAFGRTKSKMLLPHRFAIGCEDGLADPEGKGWVVRQDIVWQKLNGLPESVTDRCRDSHEYLFHLVKEPRYFAAVDEVREPHNDTSWIGRAPTVALKVNGDRNDAGQRATSASVLGKLPGSVWALPSEPLIISDEVKAHYDLPDHFAAFPTELVRRVILGWSPSGVCTVCGEGRRPVVADDPEYRAYRDAAGDWNRSNWSPGVGYDGTGNRRVDGRPVSRRPTITGYACPCGIPAPPTRPAVILDPFLGSGTTTMVARALGRIGVGTDLSADYCRLAQWRTFRSGGGAKAVCRTNVEAQEVLL